VLRNWTLAALGYLAAALYLLWPAWTAPEGWVGDWTHPDMISNHWLYRWVADVGPTGLLHNDRYYFPVGDAPWLAGNGSDAVLYGLLAPLGLGVTGWVVLTLVGNGLAGMALGRAAGATHGAAAVAGAFLVICPYVSREIAAGRFAQAPLWPSALFLAAWLRLLDAPSLARGVGAGLLFGLCAFGYWYYGLWMAMAGAILWLGRRDRRALVSFVPVALAVTVPPLAVFARNWQAVPGVEELVFPHPIAVDNAMPVSFPVWPGTGELANVVLPLTLLVLWVRGRPTWPQVAAASWFAVLALGPELLGPDGTTTGVPGPFQLVYGGAEALRRLWWPYRHVAPLLLVLLPVAAVGLSRLQASLRAAPALVALALPVELYARGGTVQVPASYLDAPEVYEELTAEAPGHLVELPLAAAITRSQASLAYQAIHGRTLVNGHGMWVARVRPAAWDTWLQAQPLLGQLVAYEGGAALEPWSLAPGGLQPLLAQGVRWISVNREFFPGELEDLRDHHRAFLQAVCGPPKLRGQGVWIWDLAACPGGDWTFPAWKLPDSFVDASGRTSIPGNVPSAGFRAWPRSFPPSVPTPATATNNADAWADLPSMVRRKLEREAEQDGEDTGS